MKADQQTEISGKKFTGRKISLDFQEAAIKNVFRVITELSGINIVSGEDVKGTITVHMKNVPWDQALETILDTNGLGMKRTGEVIAVFPIDKMRKAEEERLKDDVARGLKPQISIEAKIVQASTSFSRQLGVQWGAQAQSGNYWSGFTTRLMSSNVVTVNRNLGVMGSTYATNLGNLGAVVAPTLGVIVGTSQTFLDLELSALEATGDVKIISTPKVTTMDNVKAYIKQGQDIPYIVTEISSGATVQTVNFKEAVLQLDVKPSITPDGLISLEVKAKDDQADYATMKSLGLSNPPIDRNEISSTLVVRDGDTVVLGGIRTSSDTKGMTGIPWLSQLPFLGWLFKAQDLEQSTSELLIFITPRIIRAIQTEKNKS